MTLLPYILLGLAALGVLLELLIFLRPLLHVAKAQSPASSLSDIPSEASPIPKASVVIFVASEDDELDETLGQLMNQSYPDYEVILIFESVAETAAMLAEKYCGKYPNLYITFIPPGSHNLSRRKLAQTVGIKAAKGDVVVISGSNIDSFPEYWLENMMRPFHDASRNCDISLGYTHYPIDDLHGIWKWYREFDFMMIDARWISAALNRRPYRGSGKNMAFRRSLFFEHKGYSSTINLQNGDDDLFVSELSTPGNTEMILDPATILFSRWYKSGNRMWKEEKEQYDFTRRWLPKRPFVMAGCSSATQWVVLGACVAAAITGWSMVIPPVIAAVILLSFWGVEIAYYRRCATKLRNTRLWWSVPVFLLARPIVNFFFRCSRHSTRKHNYTWQRNPKRK